MTRTKITALRGNALCRPARKARPPAARLRRLALGACLLLAAAPALAVEEDGRLWAGVLLKAPLGENIGASLLVQPRIGDDFTEVERVLVRPGLSLRLSEHWSVGVGYDSHTIREPRRIDEHRAHQWVTLTTPWEGLGISQRAMLEERILENTDGASVRLRYRLRASAPLFETGLDAIVSNELFLTLNSLRRGPDSGFDEDRVFIGVQHAFSKQVSIEGGYLFQWLERTNGDLANHVAGITITLSPWAGR